MSVRDTAATLRWNRVYAAAFTGPGQSLFGVTLDEYEQLFRVVNEQIGRWLGLRVDYRVEGASVVVHISGRGSSAVLDVPRGTYTVTLTAQDVAENAQLAGVWESSYSPDGRFTVRQDGKVNIEGTHELALDQIVFRNERGATACPNSGK